MVTLPKEFRDSIARTRGYLQRGQIPRTLESLSQTLRYIRILYATRIMRRTIEVHINSILRELTHHPSMCPLLDPQNTGTPHELRYRYGKEGLTATVLSEFAYMLRQQNHPKEFLLQQEQEARLHNLMQKGLTAIRRKEFGRGKAFLLRAAVEFEHDAPLLSRIGKTLMAIKYYAHAGKIFEKAIALDNKNTKNYRYAIHCHMQAAAYEKAEKIFILVLRRFGSNPRTWGRMAQMYLLWEQPDKALDFASRALLIDEQQEHALTVMRALAHQDMLTVQAEQKSLT